ncbi:ABC-type nitrate/sulfonate/bicarbonate transport system substrate-binding protein [Bradyrhizobium sp. LM3.6]
MSINSLHHSVTRRLAASLLAAAITLSTAATSFAADAIVLRVGDQKGGNRSLLEISGYAKDLPYKIEWSEFPAAAPILEALNAGALDVGYTGDLSFLSVYAAGAPIKAIGGTRSDAKTQAILVRQDSPIKSAADLKGKRLAGTRGGWGQFLIDRHAGEGADQAGGRDFRAARPGRRQDRVGRGLDRCLGSVGALRLVRDAPGQRSRDRRW